MRVMGVDPGLTRCGCRSWKRRRSPDHRARRRRGAHPVRRASRATTPHDQRCRRPLDGHHLPDVIAIEPCSPIRTRTPRWDRAGRRRDRVAAAKRNIDVYFHTPSEVKAAVTATAAPIRLRSPPWSPESWAASQTDARRCRGRAALAICHCWRAPMIARMAAAEAKVVEQRKKFAAKVKAAT